MDDLDSIDRRILTVLAEDARLSWRDLAERINLSLTPTIRRVRALENEGYILGYNAALSETKLSGELNVFVSVSLNQQNADALALFDTSIQKLPEVMDCYLMTGDADYLLRIVVRNILEYQRMVHELSQIPGVNHIKSSFALRPVIQKKNPKI
ncbi:Lrp/AsnC family transcriptional regulator [Novosphingobium rosa]|uniref:Lrp/AsnC family transcriptional regulator n=1 Tax=Novosphingobium rosa TaxID=76978 RepID=UPI00082AFE73|nr:Lrp/AsnC family transcriptional regulator [Novosphingobium rosa]